MRKSLRVQDLLKDAFLIAKQCATTGWLWLFLFAALSGAYRAAMVSGVGDGWLALVLAVCVFIGGVRYSLSLFRAMLGTDKGTLASLVHANAAAAVAQAFVGLCLLFFVAAFGVMMLQLSGLIDLSKEVNSEAMSAAQSTLYNTPYGIALIVVFALAGLIMAFMALRLLLVGPATVTDNAARVFRTWTLTNGQALNLGLASLVTHVLPLGAAMLVVGWLQSILPKTLEGAALLGVGGALALFPFFLLGHALAVAVYRKLAVG